MKMEVCSCIYIVNDDTVNIVVINKPDDLIGEKLYSSVRRGKVQLALSTVVGPCRYVPSTHRVQD